MSQGNDTLLKVKNLEKYFPIRRGVLSRVVGQVKAVDGLDFTIKKGEVLGMVGESGCGKTTAGRSLLRLIEPTAGSIEFDGHDVMALKGKEMRNLRRRMQIIFQDPYSSLNPRMTVGAIIAEGIAIHNLASGAAKEKMVMDLLARVGMDPDYINRYPHEFSGGQRQRICIARALALNPDFIVCDESVSALDVSIQAQVINLLMDLKEERGLSYLFISHDLSVVKHISDRVALMYLGKIVEMAPTKDLYSNPQHPYTKALLSAIPQPNPTRKTNRVMLEGDVPSPINPPSGCAFHTRCPVAKPECSQIKQHLKRVGDEHSVACHIVTG